MSVGRRVTKAYTDMLANEPAEALFQICAAVEATAKREGRLRGKKGFKAFLTHNVPLISIFAFGQTLAAVSIGGYSHPGLPLDSEGGATIEDLVYHVMRCALYHEAALPGDIVLTENRIGPEHGSLLIPKMLVVGIIMAVVASPANKKEKTEPGFHFDYRGTRFVVNEQWGRGQALVEELKKLRVVV